MFSVNNPHWAYACRLCIAPSRATYITSLRCNCGEHTSVYLERFVIIKSIPFQYFVACAYSKLHCDLAINKPPYAPTSCQMPTRFNRTFSAIRTLRRNWPQSYELSANCCSSFVFSRGNHSEQVTQLEEKADNYTGKPLKEDTTTHVSRMFLRTA